MPRSVDWVWRPWENTEIEARWLKSQSHPTLHDSMATCRASQDLCGREVAGHPGSHRALVGAVRGLSTVADYQGAQTYFGMSTPGLGFPGGSVIKNLPAKKKMWIPSLGRKDPLKKEMATHSSILAWEVSWTEKSVGPQSMGSQRVRHDLVTAYTCTTGLDVPVSTGLRLEGSLNPYPGPYVSISPR